MIIEKKNLIYLIYIIFILSITIFLSVQILVEKPKLPQVGHFIQNIEEIKKTKSEFCGFQHRNSMGFIDYEWNIEKQPSTFRIVVLGDSFTGDSCVKNEDMWPKQLEKLLNTLNLSLKFEVFNFGRGGAGTWEEVEIFKKYGLQFRPDMVILQYFYDDFTSPEVGIKARELWEKYKRHEYEFDEKTKKIISEKNFSEEDISMLIYGNVLTEYLSKVNMEKEFDMWVKNPLYQLINTTKEKNISLLIIIIPDFLGKQEGKNAELKHILSENKIQYYDFSHYLFQFPFSSIVRSRSDGHLTPFGHYIVANKTMEVIIGNRFFQLPK
jgi:hypothetical protein